MWLDCLDWPTFKSDAYCCSMVGTDVGGWGWCLPPQVSGMERSIPIAVRGGSLTKGKDALTVAICRGVFPEPSNHSTRPYERERSGQNGVQPSVNTPVPVKHLRKRGVGPVATLGHTKCAHARRKEANL